MFVAAAAVVDFAASPADINAGMTIGAASATTAYFLQYNSLFAEECDIPRFNGGRR